MILKKDLSFLSKLEKPISLKKEYLKPEFLLMAFKNPVLFFTNKTSVIKNLKFVPYSKRIKRLFKIMRHSRHPAY